MVRIQFVRPYKIGERVIDAGMILETVQSVAKRLISLGYAINPDAPDNATETPAEAPADQEVNDSTSEQKNVTEGENDGVYAIDGEIVPADSPLGETLAAETTKKRTRKKAE